MALPIVLAVLKVAAVAAGGFWMARRGVLHPAALADLSRLVIRVAVPCLIFANAAGGFAGLSAGFAVGLTPPLRHLLTVPDAPLFFLFAAVRDIGGLAVPLANLILGAMLAGVVSSRTGGRRVVQGRDALTVVFSRLLLTPGMVLLALWLGRGWWAGSGTGCVAAFVVFLQATMPSATNLAVMSKSCAGSDAERVVPGLLLACCAAAIITVPLWLTLFFRLVTGTRP